jgi:cytoskeletal protein RodZ
MTSWKMKHLQPASPKNLEMHPQGPPFSLNVVATMAESVGVVDMEDVVDVDDMEDTVDTVDTEEAVEPETATKVSSSNAKLSAILQIHVESGNAFKREETPMSRFVSSAGSLDTSKSIASPTHV